MHLESITIKNNALYKLIRIAYSFFIDIKQRLIINRLNSFQTLSKQNQKKVINNNLVNLLIHAKSSSTFYRELLSEINLKKFNIEDFKKIPISNKDIIKENFDLIKSSKFKFENLTERYTGGSTGNPLKLLSNKKADILDRAHHLYLYELFGYKKGDLILGCSGREIEPSKLRQNIFWSNSNKGDVFGEINFSSSYLTDKNISFYLEKLIDLKPKVIRSYPTFLDRLAHYILNNDIEINFKIKGVVLTSEVCLKQQVKRIEKALRCRVYLEYGNREITMFSNTVDERLIYQSSPYYCYMEILDENGSDTKIGEVGRVVTTSLINRGMPFIRYDTGDYAKVYSRNSGYMELSSILGRKSDFLVDYNNEKVYLLNTIYRTDFEVLDKIESWQFYQKVKGEVEILIIARAKLSTREEDKLKLPFEENGNFRFTIQYVEVIPKTIQGKQPFVRKDLIT